MKKNYDLSIRCYFPGVNNFTQHRQIMPLKDVEKWVESYRFTHPTLQAVSVKIWVNEGVQE